MKSPDLFLSVPPDPENPATPLLVGTILNKVFENRERGFNCLVFYGNVKAPACWNKILFGAS